MNRRYFVPLLCAFGLLFAFILNLKPSDAFAAGTIYDANTMYESGAIAATGGSITCVSNGSYHNDNFLLFIPSDVTEANKNNHYIEFKINIPVSGNYDINGDFFSCSNGGTYELSINGTHIDSVYLYNSIQESVGKVFTGSNGINLSKGENTFRIYLLDKTNGTLCGFDDIVLTNKAPQPLEIPTGLSWMALDTVAQWTADSNASGYRLQLYKDGSAVGSPVTVSSGTSYDFVAEMMQNGSGIYKFTVTAIGDGNYFTDSLPATETNGLDFYVPIKLTSDTILPDATVNLPYSFTFSSSGGNGSKSYSYSGLVNGLNISDSGLLSGTMQSEGTHNFTVSITDGRSTDRKDYQLTVNRKVTLVKAVADGNTDTATSHYIDLTFDQSITWLTNNNITLTDGTGAAVKGELSGSGKTWRLSLSQVTVQGNISLNITPPKYFIVSGSPVTVAVYKYKPSNNAFLSELKIGGDTVSGFAADQYEYNFEFPYGTKPGDAAVQISAFPANVYATVIISWPDHFPGDSIVMVTSEDSNTQHRYIIHLSVVADTAPMRKTGVADQTTADVIVNQAYTRKLSDIFMDVNSMDTLTYQVSVNGAAYIPAAENYSYIPTLSGQTTLKFIANDGTMNSTDTYTVTLNATKPKYMLTIKAGSGGSIVTGANGNYEAGSTTTISANALANYSFAGWTSSDGGSFGNINNSTTTFVMPAHPVTVMAAFTPYQPIALVKAVADGNKDTVTSTCINLTFDQSITGLTKNDITLTDGTGAAVKGELSGSGKAWRLSLSQVSLQGNITLNITSPTGYVVSGFPAVLPVYKYKPSGNDSYVPSSNQSSSQTADNILPTIKGNSIKGWNAIKEYLAESTTGNFTVDLNGSTGIPKDILKDIQGKNITLTLRLSDEMEWMIKGKDIPDSWQKEITGNTDEQKNAGSDTKSSADFNVQIALDTHHISDDLISGLTSDGETARQLSLSYEGSFGFPALLHINLDQKNKGKTVYLYYFNPSTNKLELQSIAQIDEEGNTEFVFHHASDYVILMDDGKTLSKLEDQISVTPSRKLLSIRGTKDNTAAFTIKYPQEIEKLIADGSCICSITYTSSNPATVYVSPNGKVTARKKGKATITTTININGVTRSLQSKITVKKAGIKPKKSLKQ